jgi:hypothetical protein
LPGGVFSDGWTVTATNAVGESSTSNSVGATPEPTVPLAVTDLAATPGYELLTFTWSEPGNGGSAITSYTLYRVGSSVQSNVTSGFSLTGLTGGLLMDGYTIRATNTVGEGLDSNSVGGTPIPITAPDAISDLSASNGPSAGQLQFTWSAPASNGSDITGYALYLDGVLQTAATSPVTISGLTPNAESGPWTVRATNSRGESPDSNEVTATVPGPPADVTDLTATPEENQVLLSWTDNATLESNYHVVRRLHGEVGWEPIASLAADAQGYVATELASGTAYDFGVYAAGIYGVGNIVSVENVVTLTFSEPEPIDDLAAEAGDTEITLTWSAPDDDGGSEITQYNLYLDGELLTEDVTSPLVLTGLPNDVEAGPYGVTSVNAAGESIVSNLVSATPTAGGDPDPPRSDDELHLTVDEWVAYALDYDRMQLDSGNGTIHLPCYDQDFIASIEAALPLEILPRVVFSSRGGRGCVG